MAERPPATDLRGGNTSEDSFTRLMANLAPAYPVDFQSDLLSGAASVLAMSPEGFGGALSSLPGTARVRSGFVLGSAPCEEMRLDESIGIEPSAYCWIPDPEGSKGWGLGKSGCQLEDPRLVPWDVVRVSRFPFDLRRDRYGGRLPGDCFGHFREQVQFFWHRCQGLFGELLLRWILQDKASCIPFDFWSRGLVVRTVGVPMRRSGVDSVGRETAGPTSP